MPTPAFTSRRVQVRRAVPAKQARNAPSTARSFLVASLLVSGLALGSAATFEYASFSSNFAVHGQIASGSTTQSPWMY